MITCPSGTTVPYPYVHEIGKLLLANSSPRGAVSTPRSSLPPLAPASPSARYTSASHFRTPQTTRRGEAHALASSARGDQGERWAILDLTPPMGPPWP